MDYQAFLDLAKRRRSIYTFTEEPVSNEDIMKALEAVRFAPSGANSQPWEFIVIRDKETKAKMGEIVKEATEETKRVELARTDGIHHPQAYRPVTDSGISQAPALILLCYDPRTAAAYVKVADGERNLSSGMANATVSLQLALTSLNLGCHQITTASHGQVASKFKELLKIPEPLEIYELLAVGHPAVQPDPRIVRGLDEMVHYETYDKAKFRTDEQVVSFIKEIHTKRTYR